ncbi:hypothetical protein YA0089_26285 [Pseudomonas viridiflava]|uniref:hypothetical protein n=1 Tax=Pseudomonas viridiflava TaxID=33069 RepID=UPI0018E64538|nr:hypothetical protein [Pseudomonas viridiflava]MBI6727125.1 hypothetical protein [Pseudomonas viridiflava]
MPNSSQARTDALSLAKSIDALRASSPAGDEFKGHSRVTGLADYIQNGPDSGKKIDAGQEPFLLMEDSLNEGNYLPVPIYAGLHAEQDTGLILVDLHDGKALLEPDTLVYWK